MSKDNPHGGIGRGAPGRKRHWAGPGRPRGKVKAAETEYAVERLLSEAAAYLSPDRPPIRTPPIVVARQLCATVEWQSQHIESWQVERAELLADRAAYVRLVEDWNAVCGALETTGASVFMPFGSERWQWEYRGEKGEADTAGDAVSAVIRAIAE